MEIKHGVISADSHGVLGPDAMTSRMSAKRWGDKIPHLVEVEDDGRKVERWSVYGKVGSGNVANCPAVMGEPFPHFPERWEEVPETAFVPSERLKALDIDGVDAEVLFPNAPYFSLYSFGDAEFEMDVARAYNDAMAEWAQESDRYLPLATVPFLCGPEAAAKEIERAVSVGNRGANLMGEFPAPLPHIGDPAWDPVWAMCESLGVPIHFHGSSGVRAGAAARSWKGYSERQAHSASTSCSAVTPAQVIPHLIFSGITERFPDLKVVFAEAGIGGLNYSIAAMDHEWETRHLWTEGIATRPSETVRRQMFVNFWFEVEGIKLRYDIGVDNLMWESDFPHVACYYPNSAESIEKVLVGIPEDERSKLLYENAIRIYGIKVAEPVT